MCSRGRWRPWLGSAIFWLSISSSTVALATPQSFNIESADAPHSLLEFGKQSTAQILFATDRVKGNVTHAVHGTFEPIEALHLLLQGTHLVVVEKPNGVLVVEPEEKVPISRAAAPPQQDTGRTHNRRSNRASLRAGTGDTGDGADRNKLEDIVITALRYEQRLEKVPVSVTALSQQDMDERHIRTFDDLATVVPGFVLYPVYNGSQDFTDVAIRGIFSGGNAPTTQFYIDETPVAIRVVGGGPSGSPHPEIFDLDRVEVLRGPQGTLFGSSAMGGAVRYITPQPNLHQSSGYAKPEIAYTRRGAPSFEAGMAYGAPIVPGVLGFRASAWYQAAGGFIDKEDAYTGEILRRNANWVNSYVVRPALTWSPADGLTITPSLFIQHYHSLNPDTYWTNYLPALEPGAHVSGSIFEPLTDDLNVSSIAVKYEFAGLTLQSDTSYLDRHNEVIDDFTHAIEDIEGGAPFIPGVPRSFQDYFRDSTYTHAIQQELRLSSADPASRLTWVAGIFYRRAVQGLQQCLPGSLDPLTEAIAHETTREFTGFDNYVLPNGQVCNAYSDYQTTDVSEAVFGEVTMALLPRLKANIGVRVEHAVVQDQKQIAAGPTDGVEYISLMLPDQVGTPITPRVGLTYQYTDRDMIYLSAAKGYRAGGGNSPLADAALCKPSLRALGLTSAPDSFSSDSLWSYEIGAKDSFLDRRIALQASAFWISWRDIQTAVQLPSCGGGFTANRGKAISRGFDLQFAAIVTEGIKIGGSVGYTDAFYPKATYGAPAVYSTLAAAGVPVLLNDAGDKLPNILPWTATANVEFSRDISPLWDDSQSYLRIEYRWLSAGNALNPNVAGFDPQTGPYQAQAYGLLNLRLGVLHQGLDLSAYVNNLTQSDPRLGFIHDNTDDPQFGAQALRPLTAGISAYYRF